MTEVVDILQQNAKHLAEQYDPHDIRAHRVVSARAVTTAPEGFFTKFDTAVQQGVAYVKSAGVSSQRDALQSAQDYVQQLQTSDTSRQVVLSFMLYELLSFDILDPLIREPSVHEIAVDLHGAVSITVHGAQRPVNSIRFRDRKQLSTVINRLLKTAAQKQRVDANTIRAVLKNGATIEVSQQGEALSLHFVKKARQAAPAPTPVAAKPSPSRPQRRKTVKAPQDTPTHATTQSDGVWRTDPKTGKRYKVIGGISKDFLKSAKKKGKTDMSLEELMKYTADDPDFDGDDLNSAAETFMAHLRVPPNKAEQEQLRKERAERIRKMRQEHPEEWGLITEDTE